MNIHTDCRYWGLTRLECAQHHSRLTRYFAGQARRHAATANRSLRLARLMVAVVWATWLVTLAGLLAV